MGSRRPAGCCRGSASRGQKSGSLWGVRPRARVICGISLGGASPGGISPGEGDGGSSWGVGSGGGSCSGGSSDGGVSGGSSSGAGSRGRPLGDCRGSCLFGSPDPRPSAMLRFMVRQPNNGKQQREANSEFCRHSPVPHPTGHRTCARCVSTFQVCRNRLGPVFRNGPGKSAEARGNAP